MCTVARFPSVGCFIYYFSLLTFPGSLTCPTPVSLCSHPPGSTTMGYLSKALTLHVNKSQNPCSVLPGHGSCKHLLTAELHLTLAQDRTVNILTHNALQPSGLLRLETSHWVGKRNRLDRIGRRYTLFMSVQLACLFASGARCGLAAMFTVATATASEL